MIFKKNVKLHVAKVQFLLYIQLYLIVLNIHTANYNLLNVEEMKVYNEIRIIAISLYAYLCKVNGKDSMRSRACTVHICTGSGSDGQCGNLLGNDNLH